MSTALPEKVLGRASELVGGPDALARRLAVPRIMVRGWIAGVAPTPPFVFFRAVDILRELESFDRPANHEGGAALRAGA
jgi:hypothetical protein